MAEYVLAHGDDPAEVARLLIDNSADADHVHWYPRPDVPGGGVFVVEDESVAANISQEMARRRAEAEAARAAAEVEEPAAGEPADEDEATEDETEEGDGEPVADDPATPEDESKMTPAQRRAARKAEREAAAAQAAAEGESE